VTDDGGSIRLALVQPSVRRREWELLEGEEVRATMRISPFRSGARAEASGRSLRIQRRPRLRATYVVRDETTGEDVAASTETDSVACSNSETASWNGSA